MNIATASRVMKI